MEKRFSGQVWKNGKIVVSVQKNRTKINLVLFRIDGNQIRFKETRICDTKKEALKTLKFLNCSPTGMNLDMIEKSLLPS